jgi:hypothetical protein
MAFTPSQEATQMAVCHHCGRAVKVEGVNAPSLARHFNTDSVTGRRYKCRGSRVFLDSPSRAFLTSDERYAADGREQAAFDRERRQA